VASAWQPPQAAAERVSSGHHRAARDRGYCVGGPRSAGDPNAHQLLHHLGWSATRGPVV